MSEIEKGTGARGLLFVFLHDASFNGQVGSDKFGCDFLILRVHCFEFREHGRIPNGSVFDDLGESLAKYVAGEGAQGARVREDEARLLKGSEEVFRKTRA